MYGQMTAGSWIYIGTQGILQGTYETFAELARQHFGGSLKGRVCLTAGVGGMGGAQPLAITMNDGVALDRRRRSRAPRAPPRAALPRPRRRSRARRRLREVERAKQRGRGVFDRLRGQRRGGVPAALSTAASVPTRVTDQTSAHDLLNGYVPAGVTLDEAAALRSAIRPSTSAARWRVAASHVAAMVRYLGRRRGRLRLRQQHPRAGAARRLRARLRLSGIRAGVHPPALLPRFRTVPLRGALGRSGRHRPLRRRTAAALSARRSLRAGSSWRASASRSKACRRASAGSATAIAPKPVLAFNELVRSGEVKAPIVIGRDHLDTGSVASPYRETEAMKDGSDAIADWPILNALLNTAAGAHWVSFHHGGGVGIGYSLHAGMVVVADGSDDARERLERVLDDRLRHGRRAPRRRRLRHRDRNGRREGHRLALLIVRAQTIVPCDSGRSPNSGADFESLGRVDDGAVLIDGERVLAVGRRSRRWRSRRSAAARLAKLDAGDAVVLPGMVDAHAHPLFAGDREPDFAARLRGEPTRSAWRTRSSRRARRCSIRRRSTNERFVARLQTMLAHGTTTLETKTGYALHKPGESALLDLIAAHRDETAAPRLSRRFSAHTRCRRSYCAKTRSSTIRRSSRSGRGRARRRICGRILRARILLTGQTRRYLDAARLHGIRLRVHCDEMAYGGAAAMAAGLDVDAVDHCNYIRRRRRARDRPTRHRGRRLPGDHCLSRPSATCAGARAAWKRVQRWRWRATTIRERRRVSTCRRSRISGGSCSVCRRPRRSTA